MARRRSPRYRATLWRRVAIAAAVTVLLLVAVAAASRSAAHQVGYRVVVDRSFGRQAQVLARASASTAQQLSASLTTAPAENRQVLQVALDHEVAAAQSQRQDAAALASTPTTAQAAARFAAALTARASAATTIRTVLDGLLQMAPLPIPGAPSVPAVVPPPLTAAQAQAQLAGAQAALVRSDLAAEAAAVALLAGPAHFHLHPSPWATVLPFATPAAIQAFVGAVTASPALAASHDLRIGTVTLDPPPLPSQPDPQVIAVLPGTALTLGVVVRNLGNVVEQPVAVVVTITHAATGAYTQRTAHLALLAGTSAAASTGPVTISPGQRYEVTISVLPPPGDPAAPPLLRHLVVEVAPGAGG